MALVNCLTARFWPGNRATFFTLLLAASSYQQASAQNQPPWISNIPDLIFPAAQLTISTNFTINDPETPPEQLTVKGRSSNTNFVRDEDILFSGTGSNRTMTVSRVAAAIGSATVTATVTDPEG